VAADESTDQIGIPAVTDECLRRWAEQSGLDRVALEQCLADPERELVDRPPRWTGLSSSSGSRFLLAVGGEACFALTPSEIPGHEYQAITCGVRNRSMLARELPPPPSGRHWPIGIALVVLLVLVAIGAGVYALANSGGGSSTHKATPTTARAIIAARFGGERDPALRGLKLGRARAVHHRRGRLPREVCAPLRGRSIGRYCIEISGTTVVSRWVVPRGKPDRDRFRVLCTGAARSQGRCSSRPLR
jgi:hypothetical protein